MEHKEKFPTVAQAESLIAQADEMNKGAWTEHCKVAAFCARKIAEKCSDLNADKAYVYGLLHDIGRREGVTDMKHIIHGYNFMKSLGYDECAKICLTHSFPYQDINAYNGKNDCTDEETEFVAKFLSEVEYNDYDKLIQLCDALALPSGVTFIEKRLVDVALRRGVNDLTVVKWKKYFELKDYFDAKTRTDIYKLIGLELNV